MKEKCIRLNCSKCPLVDIYNVVMCQLVIKQELPCEHCLLEDVCFAKNLLSVKQLRCLSESLPLLQVSSRHVQSDGLPIFPQGGTREDASLSVLPAWCLSQG